MASIPETFQTAVEHHRAGRLLEAEHFYRRVLQAHLRHAGAVHLLGLIAFQAGKHEVAAQYVSDAIKFDAFRAQYHTDLGEICDAMGKVPEAIVSFERAIGLNYELPAAHVRLAMLHRKQGKLEQAIHHLEEALGLDPQLADAHHHLGATLQNQGKLCEAQGAYEEAIRLAPDDANSYFRLGTVHQEQGGLLEAIACYHKAARLKPDLDGVAFQLATVRLARGEFAGAWKDFDIHFRRAYPVTSSLPIWTGGDLRDKKVWLHARYAPGDVFQFIRFARLLEEQGAEVYVDPVAALAPLLAQSGFKVATADQAPQCDLQTHLLSLPRILGTTLETIPAGEPYLSAGPVWVKQWRKKLASMPGMKIGIAWQGNPAYALNRSRSIPLTEFAPLAKLPGATLVSLQKRFGVDQLAPSTGSFAVVDFGSELDDASGAFVDSAAMIANLDLVITSDSAIAHLAGAVGAPVWVALPIGAGWRWLENRDDSPWYPTMRLFRQSAAGDWSEVFERIAIQLSQVLSERPAGS